MAADVASARTPTERKPARAKKHTHEAPLHHAGNHLNKKNGVRTSNHETQPKGCCVERARALFVRAGAVTVGAEYPTRDEQVEGPVAAGSR